MFAKFVPVAVCAVMLAGAAAGQSDAKPPAASLSPLNVEQLAVYHAVLALPAMEELWPINLAVRTTPLNGTGPGDDESCGKGLALEPAGALVHRFRVAELAQLSARKITLVDPEQGRKDVEENDPEHALGDGGSIEEAVRNGFAHGLFTLSEIQFDKKHQHAIVSYSFVCGELCGNGATVILEKTETGWHASGRCGEWISRAEPAGTPIESRRG